MGASKLLHRILNFINYANLFKINEKCHLSSIQKSQQICTSGGDVYYASRNLLSTCFYFFFQSSGNFEEATMKETTLRVNISTVVFTFAEVDDKEKYYVGVSVVSPLPLVSGVHTFL